MELLFIMKKKFFEVPIYDTKVTLIQIEPGDEWKTIKKNLPKDLSDEVLEDMKDCVENFDDNWDGGWTMTNSTRHSALILFTGFSSEVKRANVLSHEKRHLEDRILEYTNISDPESAAYLAGYLEEQFMWLRELNSNIIKYGNTSKKNS